MKRIFADGTTREVPKCKECHSDIKVVLSTYKINKNEIEKYWECMNCYCVIKKARN